MTPRKSPLETSSDAILDALNALGRVSTPSHPIARAALHKAKDSLFRAASSLHLCELTQAAPELAA